MTFQKRWLNPILFLILSMSLTIGMVAQDLDESGSLVAEEMILDDVLTGDLTTEKSLEVEETPSSEDDAESSSEATDLLLEAESILGTDETAPAAETPADELTVEDLAAEVLGEEEVVGESVTLPVVEEPVNEDMVLDEPVVEETLEDVPVAATQVEEKGVESSAVEDLALEALGEEAVAEEPAQETPKQDDLLMELGLEEVVEEAQPEAAPAEETVAVEEAVVEEPAQETPKQDDLLMELGIEEVAEEAQPEAAPAEETVAVEEAVAEEPAVESAIDGIPVETAVAEESVTEAAIASPEAPVQPVAVEMPAAEEAQFQPPVQAAVQQPAPVQAPVPVMQPEPEPIPPSVSVLLETEELKRKAYKHHATQTLEQAARALRDRQYQKARTLFESTLDTLDKLGRRPEDQKIRERARDGLAETFYRWAIVFRKQNDIEAALQMARSASVVGHPKAPKLVGEIEREKISPPPPPPPADIARWDNKEFKKEQLEIAQRLKDARQYYMTGEYDQARIKFRGILKMDPFNTEAIRMLEKTVRKMQQTASMELDATREGMLAELRKAWNPRDYGIEEEDQAPRTGDGSPQPDDTSQSDRVRILRKMESIIIPQIEFHQANIYDVIDFLQTASAEYDTADEDDPRRGVNIILNLGTPDAGSAAAPSAVEDPFAAPSTDTGPAIAGVPSITFTARHLSLLEALTTVTKVANLKHRIEGSIVMILPWDAPTGEIIVRPYDVLPSVEERISEVSAQLGQGETGGFGRSDTGGGFGSLDRAPSAGQAVDWKRAFTDMGVKWPQGSSIKYVRAMGKLVVANTADNLTTFEQILAELNVVPTQIEIEARFVEVGQTDLDSLGFEWMLNDNWEVAQRTGQGNTALSGRQRLTVQQNASSGGFTTGNRFLQGASGLTGAGVSDSIMTIRSMLTNPDLSLVLHALQQKGSTDLLSAPKILTQSGVAATIKVVTEYVYPTDFEVTPITASSQGGSGNSQIVGGVVEPSGFETREVGVILNVTPEVSPEGQMIDLTMMPEVVSEPVWKNYGTTYTDENGNTQQLPMEQPFFFTRSISSTISIYNGATVVMGGMITEVRNEVNDRIPFLGDIPLLGRLFRSSYEQSEKRNLLIFVTAKLVDPAGRPL